MSGVAEAVQNLNTARLGGVRYVMARTPNEFRKAHELMRAEGVEDTPLGFPTVLAFEGDVVVGLFSTVPKKDTIIAGPMVLKSDRPRKFTALRLMEAYDSIMRTAGVSTYTTFIERKDKLGMGLMERLPNTEWIGENIDGVLFARRL